jgi:hypothetical protein
MPKGFQADRQDILIAMYGYFITEESGPYVNIFDFKRKSALLLSSSHIALLLESLQKEGLLLGSDDENGMDTYSLNEAGIIVAEREIVSRGMTLDEFAVNFPRRFNSGLIVETDHPQLELAKEVLDELEAHLRTDNDVGDLTPDDRQVALNEVSELRIAIEKSRIRTSYLWTKANEALFWISEKAAGAAIGELAKKALLHIHSFINVFFN